MRETWFQGAYTLWAGSTLAGEGTNVADSSSILTITGEVTNRGVFELRSGILDGPGTFHVVDGATLTWTVGAMRGPGTTLIEPGGRLQMACGDNYYVNELHTRTLYNAGTVWWGAQGELGARGSVIHNAGSFTVEGPNAIKWDPLDRPPAFYNSGTFFLNPNSRLRLFCIDSLNSALFHNTGTLLLASNSLLQLDTARVTNSNAVNVQGGTLWAPGGYLQTAGVTCLATGKIDANMTLLNGSLTGHDAVSGNLYCDGEISPGSPMGILNVGGSLYLSNHSVVTIELRGVTPGTEHDQINVQSDLYPAGTLAIRLANGYMPKLGDRFQILTARHLQYWWLFFSKVSGLSIGNGLRLAPLFSDHGLELVTMSAPRADQTPISITRLAWWAELSWPPEFAGFYLQTTTNLTFPTWITLGVTWTNNVSISTDPSRPLGFFRLKDVE